jgi:calcium-dependent protein kinase
VAPEVLKNCYDELCDMWSCGTILFVLLSGDVPFSGDTSAQILARVSKGKYSTTGSRWQYVSQDAIDLIGELLTRASSRLSAEKALEHRWISLKAPKAVGAISDCGGLICQMKQFQAANKFKKVALQIIANEMDDASSNSLRQIFEELDSNSDGLLNMTELKGGLEKAGMLDAPNIQELMSSIDVDGTGEIDYTEFLSAALSPEQYQKDDILWSAFRRIDRDGNGKISRDEMLAVLDHEGCSARVPRRARTPQNEIDTIFERVDHNCDGEIDFTEFKDMMGA